MVVVVAVMVVAVMVVAVVAVVRVMVVRARVMVVLARRTVMMIRVARALTVVMILTGCTRRTQFASSGVSARAGWRWRGGVSHGETGSGERGSKC